MAQLYHGRLRTVILVYLHYMKWNKSQTLGRLSVGILSGKSLGAPLIPSELMPMKMAYISADAKNISVSLNSRCN